MNFIFNPTRLTRAGRLLIWIFGSLLLQEVDAQSSAQKYAIVIHGGAGVITRQNMGPEKEKIYQIALDSALSIGERILKDGGTSLDAVEQTIRFMENSPLFNAGRGAVFTNEGKNELDASIMVGRGEMAGAVGGITNVKNPISAAIAVMQKSPHVMMAGKGAEKFCETVGLEIVDPSYFYTEERYKALQRALQREQDNPDSKRGTVGCVALDIHGDIVAGTSTGGMTNKKYGRIGDAPIIGAGTYANNGSCGVSCTGHGEFFIRHTVARNVAAMMEYGGKTCIDAAKFIIHEELKNAGGEGGLIAIDKFGNVVMEFNSEGMYRGYATPKERGVFIFKD